MLLADMSLSLEPAWPWSLPTLGYPALVGVALLLGGLTVWTYLGVRKATWRRVALVLVLRLLALMVALSMMVRPSVAVTQLEGVEATKLLAIIDASESMNVAEVEGKPTRWEQVNRLWASGDVQRRLEQLRTEQRIEVVKYLAAEELRPDEPSASASGKRSDVGLWLHQLKEKHGHEKRSRGVLLFSDGADNGTRFSAQEKAREWRGIAPIHAFGAGDPKNPKYRKDLGLTGLDVMPKPVSIKSKMTIKAVAQAAGFKDAEIVVNVSMNAIGEEKAERTLEPKKLIIKQEKDQPINLEWIAPEEPGEYKLTLKITPQPDEANAKNNEISTYVQVIKQKINVLWVDRPRFYESIFAIRLALAPEDRFVVRHFEPPSEGVGDPWKFYEFEKTNYDVIVIGDVSAQQFTLGKPDFLDTVRDMVTKKNTGLLMLGGTETFGKGGWAKYPEFMNILPAKFPTDLDKAEFVKGDVTAVPTKEGLAYPFLKLDPDPTKNAKIWNEYFEPLEGLSPLLSLTPGSEELLKGKRKGEIVMAATQAGGGRVAVFAGDSTWRSWLGSPEAAPAYKRFWKQLVFRLANQEDQANQLVIHLDKRRLNANAGEALGFTFSLRGKSGSELAGATYKAKVVGPDQEFPVNHARKDQQQIGTFQGAKVRGEHRLAVEATGTELDGSPVERKAAARFLVEFDDIELLRPLADHETLAKIAANAEGRFHLADEKALLQYLDELRSQVNRESRMKTTNWPDWKRLPASARPRDQLAGLWDSFALVTFLFFVVLVGAEWGLRRVWGLV